jgi:hypothetical protein
MISNQHEAELGREQNNIPSHKAIVVSDQQKAQTCECCHRRKERTAF